MELNLTELTRQPLYRQIANQVRTKILTEAILESAPLLPVRDLAREQRVSVASVERAYEMLVEQGLVERIGHETYRVAELSEKQRHELARRRLFDRLREQELSLSEIELARDIQCRLLPPEHVEGRGYVVVSRSEPARFMTGDFYDVIPFGDRSVGVVVADVAGKGMGASLIMASVKAMLPFVAAQRSVEETLGELNRRLARDLGRREFVALAYARFDPESRIASIANAGLPDPWIMRPGPGPEVIELPGERVPLGIRRTVDYERVDIRLEPGERLLFVTDGIPEAATSSGEPLGYQVWTEMLGVVCRAEEEWSCADVWLDCLLQRFEEATNEEPGDDRTIVVLESRPSDEADGLGSQTSPRFVDRGQVEGGLGAAVVDPNSVTDRRCGGSGLVDATAD